MMHLPPTDPGLGAGADLHAQAESSLRERRMRNSHALSPTSELWWIIGKLVRVVSLPVRIPLSLIRRRSR